MTTENAHHQAGGVFDAPPRCTTCGTAIDVCELAPGGIDADISCPRCGREYHVVWDEEPRYHYWWVLTPKLKEDKMAFEEQNDIEGVLSEAEVLEEEAEFARAKLQKHLRRYLPLALVRSRTSPRQMDMNVKIFAASRDEVPVWALKALTSQAAVLFTYTKDAVYYQSSAGLVRTALRWADPERLAVIAERIIRTKEEYAKRAKDEDEDEDESQDPSRVAHPRNKSLVGKLFAPDTVPSLPQSSTVKIGAPVTGRIRSKEPNLNSDNFGSGIVEAEKRIQAQMELARNQARLVLPEVDWQVHPLRGLWGHGAGITWSARMTICPDSRERVLTVSIDGHEGYVTVGVENDPLAARSQILDHLTGWAAYDRKNSARELDAALEIEGALKALGGQDLAMWGEPPAQEDKPESTIVVNPPDPRLVTNWIR